MIDKTRYPKNPFRNPTQKQLRQTFGDLEIVDASEPLMLFPSEDDFKHATKLDPHNCGFARCASRQVGAGAALVFVGTSYFDHVGKDGVRRIYRYVNATPVKGEVKKFDEKGWKACDFSKAFKFLPPADKSRLDYQRKKGKRYRAQSGVILNVWLAKKNLSQAKMDYHNQKDRLEQLTERLSPQAPSVLQTKKQVERLRTRLKSLREDIKEKEIEAQSVRVRAPKKAKTKATLHNLHVRNGSGYLDKAKLHIHSK